MTLLVQSSSVLDHFWGSKTEPSKFGAESMASLKASPTQLERIKQARIGIGWPIDSDEWLLAASRILNPKDFAGQPLVSTSTFKRFLAGKPVRPDIYKALCQVLGLPWEEMIELSVKNIKLSNKCDWGEIPDSSRLLSRSLELTTLRGWVEATRARSISIVGMGGIGKTLLIAKLAQDLAPQFDYVIWRSLREAPPIEKILADWIKFISEHQSIDLPELLGDRITMVVELLRNSRCLLVLDNAESLCQSGSMCGQYLPELTGYGELFHRLGTSNHQSCLLITSREQLPEFRRLASPSALVRTLLLPGLGQEATQILTDRHLSGSPAEMTKLVEVYQGNPLALEIVAATIQQTFSSRIADFFQTPTIFGDIKDLLTGQFDRLSTPERSLMYWLAIHREPVKAKELAMDSLDHTLAEIVAAIDSLGSRSLIWVTQAGFTLQNVVMEYVTDHFIHAIDNELVHDQLALFKTHAILQATAKDHIRSTQQRLLLTPIVQSLTAHRSIANIERKFKEVIAHFRENQRKLNIQCHDGYGIGNIINLLIALQVDLTGYDFSGLIICQAYLAGVDLPEVKFANSYFKNTVFSQNLSSIFSVTFSPDSQIIATGGMDGYIRLWQVNDGAAIAAWPAHQDWIRHVTFSPDGQRIASSSNDKTIKIWDWQKSTCLQVLRGHKDWVWLSKFIVWKGLTFLMSVSTDRTGKIWNVDLGKCVFTLHEPKDAIWAIAFGNDGYTVAFSTIHSVKLWNIWTKKIIRQVSANAERIRALAFSPDSKTLVGANEEELIIWQVETGQCLNTLELPDSSAIWLLNYTSDGQQLIAAGIDKIQIFNAKNWQPETTIFEPQYRIRSIAYSPDRMMMAVGSDDGLVRIWDTHTTQSLKTLRSSCNRLWTIAISPAPVSHTIHLASGSDDGQIRIWDGETGLLLRTQLGHRGRIRHLAFSPSGKLLASASHDRTIKLWDAMTGDCLQTLHGYRDWVWGVAFMQDDDHLIGAADDRQLLLWDMATHESQSLLDINIEWIWAIASHPHLPLLAITLNNQNIQLLHLNDRQKDFTIPAQHRIRAITFNQAGHALATSSDDFQVQLWHLDSSQTGQYQLQCIQTFIGHTQEIRTLTFIPASTTHPEYLASASDDLTIRIWNLDRAECVAVLRGHDQAIWSICYSPDLEILYSCGEDEAIHCWNLKTFTRIHAIRIPKPYRKMDITGIEGLSGATQTTLIALGATSKE